MRNSPTLSLILRHHMRCFHLDKNQWQESKSEPGVFWKDFSIGHFFKTFHRCQCFSPSLGPNQIRESPDRPQVNCWNPFIFYVKSDQSLFYIFYFHSPTFYFTSLPGSGEPGRQFSIPITKLGEKKYYLGIFFKVMTCSPKLFCLCARKWTKLCNVGVWLLECKSWNV